MNDRCPCCSGLQYNLCCQRYLSGEAYPHTPEKLMRSRYSAWYTKNANYLIATWHPQCHPQRFLDRITANFSDTEWQALNVISYAAGRNENEGFVTFFASYSHPEKQQRGVVYERSRFLRENERWYYIDGIIPPLGRNDTCPCGSGKKYKKCCAP
ncbi:YchJ family metal-binding protein [Enterobacteriaceae bacterium LUAb1]